MNETGVLTISRSERYFAPPLCPSRWNGSLLAEDFGALAENDCRHFSVVYLLCKVNNLRTGPCNVGDKTWSRFFYYSSRFGERQFSKPDSHYKG